MSQLRSVVAGRPDASLALASLCAYERLQGGVLLTPLLPSAHLAAASGAASVMLKMENEQYTGSFKCRGAVNKQCCTTQRGSLVVVGEDCVEAETAACQQAQQSGLVYVSPYNDLEVRAGAGQIKLYSACCISLLSCTSSIMREPGASYSA
ncbi:serine/threonine dehydratase [Haematococcus lacustris]|uniref:Serine/threonine dehydratase n=1 Tax=Haematococcus lacustris TaxID=44745 RepID=A0A699ZSW4_HAELA|nr:serine/threonine dehydratase [Haematococcus lacustris]